MSVPSPDQEIDGDNDAAAIAVVPVSGRWWFAVTALIVFVGLAIQLPVAMTNEEGYFDTRWLVA